MPTRPDSTSAVARTVFWGVALATTASLLACGSSSVGVGVTCGEGTVLQGSHCVVSAVADATVDGPVSLLDAADAREVSVDAGAEAEAGDAAGPIAFGGVTAVAPASTSRLLVVWNPGVDDSTPPSPLAYRVYVGPAASPLSYTMPALTTATGAVDASVGGLHAGTMYTVGVRAVNAAGVEDTNTVELVGVPKTDTTAPTFGGVSTAAPGGSGAVALTWAKPAMDALTPVLAMSYLVYVGTTPGGEDFTSPVVLTPPGASSATVSGLPNAMQARYFVVRARDAEGNEDSNTVERASTPGPDVVPPVFGGCTSATLVSGVTIAVSWQPATDDVSSPANLTYDVFLSETSGQYDFSQPFVTVPAQTQVVIPALMAATRYYFVCRARDQAGNEDSNTVEVNALTGTDSTPPVFGGITGFVPDPVGFTVALSWSPATDAMTPPSAIVYDVYEATTSMGEAFMQPPLVSSPPGATSILVSNLPGNSTLYFVVRARDSDGNHDSNTVEQSFTTNVSFSQNIQPIFTNDCGVVGCHVPGNPTGNLILAPGFAYDQIVGVAAPEGSGLLDGGSMPFVNPGDPGESYLDLKITPTLFAALKAEFPAKFLGTQMPAPQTGSTLTQAELDAFSSWISQGALAN